MGAVEGMLISNRLSSGRLSFPEFVGFGSPLLQSDLEFQLPCHNLGVVEEINGI